MTVAVRLLADVPQLAGAVAELGLRTCAPGRDDLPVTFVAVDDAGAALGAATLGDGPWLSDLVVRPDMRERGIGSMLLARLERFAVGRDIDQLHVTAGPADVDFFLRCGWRPTETDGTLIKTL